MVFSIGEFSRIAQVPASLLRYYDQIGLFTPEYIDTFTGYRFYSARQLKRLNRILALKELGLSLDQIAQLLADNVSSDEIRGMFMLMKAQAEQRLHEEIVRLRTIESRIRYMDSDEQMAGFDVVIKSIPAQSIISVRDTYATPSDALAVVTEVNRLLPDQLGDNALGPMIAVVYDQMLGTENFDIEMGFAYLRKKWVSIPLSNARQLKVRELEAIETAATTVWLGGYDRHLSYSALALWMEANQYRFAGPPREIVLEPVLPERLHEAVVEMQFPVEKIA